MYNLNNGEALYNTIKTVCARRGTTVSRMCLDIGMSKAIMSDLKAGRKQTLTAYTLSQIAAFLGVSVDSLLDGTAKEKAPTEQTDEANDVTLYKFPVIGKIAAGYDGEAVEEYTGDYDYYPIEQIHGDPRQYMVLRIKGDSMYPKLLDGDMVLVRRCTSVDSGKIAAIMYNGDEATVKKVNYVYGEDWLDLVPINPEYMTHRIEGADLEQCRVLGEVISMHRSFI